MDIAEGDPVGETAQKLIGELCAEMSLRYGSPPSPFSHADTATPRSVFLVACLGSDPVGCGALRPFAEDIAEIKRMYIIPSARRHGIARKILTKLERHARAFDYRVVRLETGVQQPEAQRLYESMGFARIPAFGPYIGNPTSVCFEKRLSD